VSLVHKSAFRTEGIGLRERWAGLRNRLIRSPGFQRWAAAFPLTRPVARRRALELFDIVGGFVYSQVLAAVVRLRILDLVADAPQPVSEIAARTGLPPASVRRLCAAAASLRLLEAMPGERYGAGDLGAALLGNPGVAAMVEHHALLYDDLRDPVALLRDPDRETALSRYWSYARSDSPGTLAPGAVADYSRLMAVTQGFVAAEILDAYPVARHRTLLDIGGGEGAFVKAAAWRAPDLRFVLFDLPSVAERAPSGFAAAGIAGRASATGGDLFRDRLPEGADLACLIRVLYDHPRERALSILRAARACLPPDGVLLIAEPMAGVSGAERMGDAYFGFFLLAMHGGEPRSAAEISALALEAGFASAVPTATRTPLLTGLVVARP
jgi:demethylspheroidene O-methyltransferase